VSSIKTIYTSGKDRQAERLTLSTRMSEQYATLVTEYLTTFTILEQGDILL